MKKYDHVEDSIWLATSILTYNSYIKQRENNIIDATEFYFTQPEIIAKTESICTKDVHNARVSQHCNADSHDNTYNYLRAKDTLRRVTYIGEFNGDKEYPTRFDLSDKVDTLDGEKTIKEIVDFLSNDYKSIIKEYDNNKLLEILNFLKIYGKKSYKNPINETNPIEKAKLEELKFKGQNALSLFKDMCMSLEDENYKNKLSPKWLDGSNRYIRGYLWSELKHKDKKDLPTSISIVAEKTDKEANFIIYLEIRDEDASKEYYLRHNKFLDSLDIENEDFEYFIFTDQGESLNNLNKSEIKKYIETRMNKETEKVRIGKSFSYDFVKDNSSEYIIDIMKDTVNRLKKYYEIAVQEGDNIEMSTTTNNNPKNLILYGPPGTGKTYNVSDKALEIIDYDKYKNIIENPTKREEVVIEFNKLKEDGIIGFCTFHQSYSYEDFVEGLRRDGRGGFEPKDGIFKQMCENASIKAQTELPKYKFDSNKISVHKMSLGDTNNREDNIYEYCIKNNCVSLGWGREIDYSNCKDRDEVKEVFIQNVSESTGKDFDINAINRFKNIMQDGDLVIISQGNHKARAIGKISGNYYYDPNSEIRYNHFRKVEWLYNGEAIDVKRILKDKVFSQQSIYTFYNEDLKFDYIKELISEKTEVISAKNYVLIIDEINRGNISKIFGELITLIEDDKRIGEKNELKVTLPYSNDYFGVPSNLYIIGTMNTADRSIALLDTALRRRFDFIEYMPNENILPTDIEGINISKLLKTINDRIEFLFDRDHKIGHAYFIKENLQFEDLVSIMKNKIIPLLSEYFYDDYEKMELILGGSGKDKDNNYLLNKTTIKANSLFKKKLSHIYPDQVKYTVVENPTVNAFINIYSDVEIDEYIDEDLDNEA